jgi:hypothetical protein
MVLLIPGLLFIMGAVRRHNHRVFLETRSVAPFGTQRPYASARDRADIKHWSRIVKKALRFTLKISPHV